MTSDAGRSGSIWWWAVGLLIAVPAVILAALGLRSLPIDRVEWEQQIGEREAQTIRLADLELENALRGIEAVWPSATDVDSITGHPAGAFGGREFSIDGGGTVVFLREGIFVCDSGTTAFAQRDRLPSEPRRVVAEAQSAEAQGRYTEARQRLARLAAITPTLADWARWTTARTQYEEGVTNASMALGDPMWSRAKGRTPGGLPVALVAAAFAGTVPTHERRQFDLLVRDTLAGLRAGTWLLSLDERRFYDDELRRLLKEVGDDRVTLADDSHLDELDALAAMIRRTAPARGARTRTAERVGERPTLLLWSATDSPGSAVRTGLALSQNDLRMLAERAIRPLVTSTSFGMALRDVAGGIVWPATMVTPATGTAHPLRAVPGWELVVTRPGVPAALSQRRLVWLGLIVMLIVMLGTGLVMAAGARQHELALARRQSDFVAAVSHEFKSPLTSIRLHIERLSSGRAGLAESSDYYTAVEQETIRLERLVNRLLDSQQLQEGRTAYAFETASIAQAAGTAVARIRPQAEAKGIRLDLKTEEPDAAARFDRDAIADAIENLVENAIKYSREGSTVSVATEVDGQAVRVHVQDRGIGIDARDLPRIFDKFFRGRRGDATDVRGTGLGLSLVKAIVEGHGGTIAVSSTDGAGSCFSMTLPRQPTEGESA